MTLDDIRARYPHLGLALYALDPGGVVTFEAHTPDGSVFTHRGATEAEALAAAFPELDGPAEVEDPPPTENVFD